jgi:DNA-binding response OmpR family regulator
VVEVSRTVREAVEKVKGTAFDLFTVDVMLPDQDGYEFVRQVRALHLDTPVLMLTAKHRVEDRIVGLDCGADDYLSKPFALGELLARVRALLRRKAGGIPILNFADIELDPSTRKVTQGGEPVYLSALQFNLLQYFVRNRGLVLSKHQILDAIWDDQGFRDPNTVEAFVSQLRAKLETKGKARVIHTVRGIGYTLQQRDSSPE